MSLRQIFKRRGNHFHCGRDPGGESPAGLRYFAFKKKKDEEGLGAAAASCRKAPGLDPAYGSAHLGLEVVLFVGGNTNASVAALESALKHDPGFHKALYFLGLNHLRLSDRTKACDDFSGHSKTPTFDSLSSAERNRAAAIIAECRKTPGPQPVFSNP